MSDYERRDTSENEDRPAIGQAAAAFVIGLVLAGVVLYFTMIAPRSAERQEARETIEQLEADLSRLDGRDAELQATVAELESEMEASRDQLLALQAENERLEDELATARAQGATHAETVERLESERAELSAAIATLESSIEQGEAEREAVEAELRALQAALEERETEIEEIREAYLVAVREAERAETERDELRQQMEREIAVIEERAAALRPQPTAPAQPETSAQPHRYIVLLTAFHEARQHGIRADDPQSARAAFARAGEILDTIEAEFPERSVERLRRDLQSLEAGL